MLKGTTSSHGRANLRSVDGTRCKANMNAGSGVQRHHRDRASAIPAASTLLAHGRVAVLLLQAGLAAASRAAASAVRLIARAAFAASMLIATGAVAEPPRAARDAAAHAPPAASRSSDHAADRTPAVDIDWQTSPLDLDLRGMNGERYAFRCPPGKPIPARIVGSGPYADNASICGAAVHAGFLSAKDGGDVAIEIRPGQSNYAGSESHYIRSTPYERAWGGSFVVLRNGTASTP